MAEDRGRYKSASEAASSSSFVGVEQLAMMTYESDIGLGGDVNPSILGGHDIAFTQTTMAHLFFTIGHFSKLHPVYMMKLAR